MGATVVAGVDGPPVLDFAELVQILVSLVVNEPVKGYLRILDCFSWNRCLNLSLGCGVA